MKIAYKIRNECVLLAQRKICHFLDPRPSTLHKNPRLHRLKNDGKVITPAEREVKDSRSSGMFESCIRRSRSCFGTSSRYLRIPRIFLSGERNNYEEAITITFGGNKEEIIIISEHTYV